MRTIDFSPLFRHSVGFDRMQRLLDAAQQHDTSTTSYPPYNIEQAGENGYRITMAITGFGEEDLDVTVKENILTIAGKLAVEEGETTYLHRGIAGRAFERRFDLADHVIVVGANLVNGLLPIDLERQIPDEKNPRKIAIGAAAIENKQAA